MFLNINDDFKNPSKITIVTAKRPKPKIADGRINTKILDTLKQYDKQSCSLQLNIDNSSNVNDRAYARE